MEVVRLIFSKKLMIFTFHVERRSPNRGEEFHVLKFGHSTVDFYPGTGEVINAAYLILVFCLRELWLVGSPKVSKLKNNFYFGFINF